MVYSENVHFVIMGSGRVGSTVAGALDKYGHSVAIIDRDSTAFRQLPANFSGQRVKGIGFDRDTLIKAGIERAYAFAAVSNGDNTNIIAARIARETFRVKHVIARIYDPRRADVYERLGIPTIGTVRWSSSMILRELLPDDSSVAYTDNASGVSLVRCQPTEAWIGIPIHTVEELTGSRVAYIRRGSKPVIARSDLVIQEHDELYISVLQDDTDRLRHAMNHSPVM